MAVSTLTVNWPYKHKWLKRYPLQCRDTGLGLALLCFNGNDSYYWQTKDIFYVRCKIPSNEFSWCCFKIAWKKSRPHSVVQVGVTYICQAHSSPVSRHTWYLPFWYIRLLKHGYVSIPVSYLYSLAIWKDREEPL